MKSKVEPLVESVRNGADGWIGEGPAASPQALLTSSLPSSSALASSLDGHDGANAGDGHGGSIGDSQAKPGGQTEDDGSNAILYVGVGAAAVAVVAAASIATFFVVSAERSKIEVTFDASLLLRKPVPRG